MSVIGIVGAGKVAGTLGPRVRAAGYDVVYAVRDPGAARHAALLERTGASAVHLADAPAASDRLLLAVPWPAVRPVLHAMGDLTGRILIDATNPLTPSRELDHQPGGLSGAERIATWARGSRVVKAFNAMGRATMESPDYHGSVPAVFVAADDALAKSTTAELIESLGYEAVDAGPLAGATDLEHLAVLWIRMVHRLGQPNHIAYSMLRRDG